jgi:hypothetical protein
MCTYHAKLPRNSYGLFISQRRTIFSVLSINSSTSWQQLFCFGLMAILISVFRSHRHRHRHVCQVKWNAGSWWSTDTLANQSVTMCFRRWVCRYRSPAWLHNFWCLPHFVDVKSPRNGIGVISHTGALMKAVFEETGIVLQANFRYAGF